MCSHYVPKRALFIFAHPDDMEFSVAGTAAKWHKQGSELFLLVLTDGAAGCQSPYKSLGREDLILIRQKEQIESGEIVGIRECIFLDGQDGLLSPTLEMRKEIVRIIREVKPDTVVCEDPRNFFSSDSYINHPDHRAAGILALESVFPASENDLLYPDFNILGLVGHKVNYVYISTANSPNCYIDIAETLDHKIRALKRHISQVSEKDIEKDIIASAEWQGRKVGLPYAESFYCIKVN